MFNLETFAKEVHENAKAHGWWEKPRSENEIRALIHSEWSEALEEARAGRPMVWHKCKDPMEGKKRCDEIPDCPCKLDSWEQDCMAYDPKPEGIAVELIDGCIRILDWLEWLGEFEGGTTATDWMAVARHECANKLNTPVVDMDAGQVIDVLHMYTSKARKPNSKSYYLLLAFGIAFEWVQRQGINPYTLIQQKHRYNRTRPYKHGKVF